MSEYGFGRHFPPDFFIMPFYLFLSKRVGHVIL